MAFREDEQAVREARGGVRDRAPPRPWASRRGIDQRAAAERMTRADHGHGARSASRATKAGTYGAAIAMSTAGSTQRLVVADDEAGLVGGDASAATSKRAPPARRPASSEWAIPLMNARAARLAARAGRARSRARARGGVEAAGDEHEQREEPATARCGAGGAAPTQAARGDEHAQRPGHRLDGQLGRRRAMPLPVRLVGGRRVEAQLEARRARRCAPPAPRRGCRAAAGP